MICQLEIDLRRRVKIYTQARSTRRERVARLSVSLAPRLDSKAPCSYGEE